MVQEVEKRRTDDFYWFIENYDVIYRQYGECYAAIRDKKIVGVFNSFSEACREMDKVSKPTDQIIQHCNGSPSGYTAYLNIVSPT